MSRRTERVGSLIRTLVAEAIRDRLSDPRIEPLTSVTRVEISADMSVARIFVSVLAPDAHRKLCLDALRHAAGRLRSLIAPELTLRQTPRLEFELDESLQRSFETIQALDEVMRELGARTATAAPAEAPPAALPDGADQAVGREPGQEDT